MRSWSVARAILSAIETQVQCPLRRKRCPTVWAIVGHLHVVLGPHRGGTATLTFSAVRASISSGAQLPVSMVQTQRGTDLPRPARSVLPRSIGA
jgi:hypothetical protein